MKKTVKKTTKKTVKPDFVMNLTNIETPKQLYNEFIEAKVRSGKAITKEELEFVKDATIAETVDEMATVAVDAILSMPRQTFEVKNGETLVFDEHGNAKIKKPGLFKRFFNWLRRK